MKDSATDTSNSEASEKLPTVEAANHATLTDTANSNEQAMEQVREILIGQYITAQSEKLAVLQKTLSDQLNTHMESVNQRLDALEQSMDKHHVSAQQSHAEIREQLKTSMTNANDELVQSQDMLQSQLTGLAQRLERQSIDKKSVARMLNEIARNLEDGAS